jgi:predicted CXXCH cytochrome family protein
MGTEYAEPALLSRDIHFKNGLSCHNCHGGDPTLGIEKGGPEDAMDPKKGYIGKPDRKQIASLCASCHSNPDFMRKYNPQARIDQYAEYLTSVHGKRYQAGDPKVATCTDCHGVHGIRPVSDPNSPVYAINVAETCGRCHSNPQRMASYGIPTNQQSLYTASVHGEVLIKNRDLSAPTCNDCHGNHGAAPPGVDSVANVCGQCHASQQELFNKSPHKTAFAENQFPACSTCHENHGIARTSDALLGTESGATCVNCHDQGSAGYEAAAQMKAGVTKLKTRLGAAEEVLERAERAGMEVSKPIYDLAEGRDKLVLARVQVHRFSVPELNAILEEGQKVAAASEQSGWKALDDLAYRRKGLAISGVILLAMIGLLLLKIRQLNADKADRRSVTRGA